MQNLNINNFMDADLALAHVIAGQTTRLPILHPSISNPVSKSPYQQFNVALHVGDDPCSVHHNRITLLAVLAEQGCQQMVWLEQVHGTAVYHANTCPPLHPPIADAVICQQQGIACVIMTADCLPIIFADTQGKIVGCTHAGWRGLLNGVIEATANAMRTEYNAHQPNEPRIDGDAIEIVAWLGTAIGASQFEVGTEVYNAFIAEATIAEKEWCNSAFVAQDNGKYLADIYALARIRLARCNIKQISGGEHCSVLENDLFYSYRAATPSHVTGRMATIIALNPKKTVH